MYKYFCATGMEVLGIIVSRLSRSQTFASVPGKPGARAKRRLMEMVGNKTCFACDTRVFGNDWQGSDVAIHEKALECESLGVHRSFRIINHRVIFVHGHESQK